MTQEQFSLFLAAITKLGEVKTAYTITGAADWPILVALAAILFAMIGYMWHDLKNSLKGLTEETSRVERESRDFAEKEDNKIWAAMRECQAECHQKYAWKRERGEG